MSATMNGRSSRPIKETPVCKACQAKYPANLFPTWGPGRARWGMGALNMGFGESAIAAVNWQSLEISGGRTADDLPVALLAVFRRTT